MYIGRPAQRAYLINWLNLSIGNSRLVLGVANRLGYEG